MRAKTAELFRLLKTGPSAVVLPQTVKKVTLLTVKNGPGAAGLRYDPKERENQGIVKRRCRLSVCLIPACA